MKILYTILFTLCFTTVFGQSIETITNKISDKICNCINGSINNYADIKPEFNRCYDIEFNQIFSLVDSSERKILLQDGALTKIKNEIIPNLNSSCEKIRKILQSEMNKEVEMVDNKNTTPCPTNFIGKHVKKIENLDGEIIAFNAMVTQVYKAYNDKPYYEVKLEGGNTIWIASLVNSGYEKEGSILRLLGYVSKVKSDDEFALKYNSEKYHILAFCIIDLDSKQMAMLPGSELQIKEWMGGRVPRAIK